LQALIDRAGVGGHPPSGANLEARAYEENLTISSMKRRLHRKTEVVPPGRVLPQSHSPHRVKGRSVGRPSTLAAALALALLAVPSVSAEEEKERGLNPSHEGYPLYQRLCASCHGLRADGKGPRAAVTDPPPADLTRLAAARGEAPRLDELTRIIDGRRTLRAHGEGPMPVWGEELVAGVADPAMREQARIRLIQSLAEYVLSIQAPGDEPEAGEGPTPP
jgi:mono/diheme cytochrome c family protein